MSERRYFYKIIGKCIILEDGDYKCDCPERWGGRNCDEKVCDGYKECEPNGLDKFTLRKMQNE